MTNRPQRALEYDLEDRSTKFGESVLTFARRLPETTLTRPLISQFIRAGTSVGANYCEADEAESKKDFRHKIAICKKEARETRYWLRLIAGAVPERREEVRPLWQEAKELTLIFSAIMRSADGKAG